MKQRRTEAALLARLDADPSSQDTWRELTNVERALGQMSREGLALEHRQRLEPNNAAVWSRHAEICSALGRFDEAVSSYRRAVELTANDAPLLEGLALALLSAHRLDSAREVRDELIEKFSEYAGTHVIDGHVHRADRRIDDAVRAYEQALAIDQRRCDAVYNLAVLRTPALDDALARRIESLRSDASLDPADRANLDFASARVHEMAQKFETAFDRYTSANAHSAATMAALGIVYKPEEMERRVDTLIARYPASSFSKPIEPLAVDLKPIFIVGLPRSGTTLVEEILASLPRVVGGGELPIAPICERTFVARRQSMGLGDIVDPTQAKEANLLLELRERYVDALFERDLCARYVTDRLPGNFLIVGFLRLLFPNAIIVHVKRNLTETCWSLFTSNFGIHDPYYNSLEHLAHYTRQYQRVMAHWRSVMKPAMVEVQHEELVAHPEQEMRRLLAAVGLPWDSRCLEFHKNRRPALTASHTEAADRWRDYAAHLQALEPLHQS